MHRNQIFSVFILLSVICTGYALKCYQCEKSEKCEAKECSQKDPTGCVKVKYSNGKEDKSCAYGIEGNVCVHLKSTVEPKGDVTACICTGDECNSSTTVAAAFIIPIISIFVTLQTL